MQIAALLSVTVPATDPEAARQWWRETLGALTSEEDDNAFDVGDVLVRFGPQLELAFVGSGDDLPARQEAPDGHVVTVMAPDLSGAQRAETTIREFVVGADDLDGPPVARLSEQVAAILADAHDRVRALMDGVPHNKVLATQLDLSQRARAAAPSDAQWPLHAASSLMSGLIIAGAGTADG